MSRSIKVTIVALMTLALSLLGTAVKPADALGSVKLTGYGGDSCTAPSVSQMQAFFSNTRFSYWGIYLGGTNRGCAQPNLTADWVTSVTNMGWDLLPIWVGPQNPCNSSQGSTFSIDPGTASGQGRNEALAAYQAWKAISPVSDVPIDYDLEGPSSNTAACRTAAKAFIDGWVSQLHVAPAQPAGVYSSACGGAMDDFSTIANPPDFIDAADWSGDPNTTNISCIDGSHWAGAQRHKQYQGGHNETMNGVTLNIDSRCANGQVFGASNHTSTTHPCVGGAGAKPDTAVALAASQSATTWRGSRWRSGGPLDSQLQRSGPLGTTDSWRPVTVADLPVRVGDVPATAATIGSPRVLEDGSLVVPVTTHDGARSHQLLYTSRDGVTFTRRSDRALGSLLAPGVGVTTAVAGTGVVAIDPDSRAVSTWSPTTAPTVGATTTATTRTTSGLPVAPEWMSFSDNASGQALVEVATCAAATKVSCDTQPKVVRTSDGGHSWR